MPTDLGLGVAIPHARCPGLADPLVVFGRSTQGIVFDPESAEPVRLVFLLVTPAEQPELQVFLLGQLARLAGNASVREQLARAATADESSRSSARTEAGSAPDAGRCPGLTSASEAAPAAGAASRRPSPRAVPGHPTTTCR